VRLQPADINLNEKVEAWRYEGRRITNFEMEGSALAGMTALMGHRATTICTIIAQRVAKQAQTDYKPYVEGMIRMALDKLATLE
jgi:uridine phosphorylase